MLSYEVHSSNKFKGKSVIFSWNRDGFFGIVTQDLGRKSDFCRHQNSQLALRPTQPRRTVVSTSGSTSEVKWPGNENDHSAQSSGGIRNERRYIPTTSSRVPF